MNEQEKNTTDQENNPEPKTEMTVEEQLDRIKHFLNEGWSITMSLSKAGIKQRRYGNPLFDHSEYKKLSHERRKRRPMGF